MNPPLVLLPVGLPAIMRVEIAIRIGLCAALIWLGVTDPQGGLLLGLCGLAALYHLSVAVRLLTHLFPGATSLTLDDAGFTLRTLWRDRRFGWGKVREIVMLPSKPFSGQRGGLAVALGDGRGIIQFIPIPGVFAPGRNQLLALMDTRRSAFRL
jgi:hypothetical protein